MRYTYFILAHENFKTTTKLVPKVAMHAHAIGLRHHQRPF